MQRRSSFLFIAIALLIASGTAFALGAFQVWDVSFSGTSTTSGKIRLQGRSAGGTILRTTDACSFGSGASATTVRNCLGLLWDIQPPILPCIPVPIPWPGLRIWSADASPITLWGCSCAGASCTSCDVDSSGFTQLGASAYDPQSTGIEVTAEGQTPSSTVPALPAAGKVALVTLVLSAGLFVLWRRGG